MAFGTKRLIPQFPRGSRVVPNAGRRRAATPRSDGKKDTIPAAVAEGLHKSLFFTNSTGPQAIYTGAPNSTPMFSQYPLLPPVLFGMRVLVPGAIKNSGKEGQSASYSDVWGETVLLAYVTPGAAIETPSLAYTFTAEPRQTRQSRDDKPRVDWFAVGETIVEKVVAPFAGYTITNCLT